VTKIVNIYAKITICALRDVGSRGFTAAALFTLTLFRRWREDYSRVTYFEDAGQRTSVRDVASILQ